MLQTNEVSSKNPPTKRMRYLRLCYLNCCANAMCHLLPTSDCGAYSLVLVTSWICTVHLCRARRPAGIAQKHDIAVAVRHVARCTQRIRPVWAHFVLIISRDHDAGYYTINNVDQATTQGTDCHIVLLDQSSSLGSIPLVGRPSKNCFPTLKYHIPCLSMIHTTRVRGPC